MGAVDSGGGSSLAPRRASALPELGGARNRSRKVEAPGLVEVEVASWLVGCMTTSLPRRSGLVDAALVGHEGAVVESGLRHGHVAEAAEADDAGDAEAGRAEAVAQAHTLRLGRGPRREAAHPAAQHQHRGGQQAQQGAAQA